MSARGDVVSYSRFARLIGTTRQTVAEIARFCNIRPLPVSTNATAKGLDWAGQCRVARALGVRLSREREPVAVGGGSHEARR